jgi:hypothetical protein
MKKACGGCACSALARVSAVRPDKLKEDSMLSLKRLLPISALLVTASAHADSDLPRIGALLSPFEETPSVLSAAKGTFEARIDKGSQELPFTLNYNALSSSVLFAHIHFAKERVAGGVITFLCGGGGKPACPQEGSISVTVTSSDIVGPEAQGLPPNSFDGLVAAIVSGAAYVNVHTDTYPQGEIRGQLKF